jgi:hypothetical protein
VAVTTPPVPDLQYGSDLSGLICAYRFAPDQPGVPITGRLRGAAQLRHRTGHGTAGGSVILDPDPRDATRYSPTSVALLRARSARPELDARRSDRRA